MGLNDEPTHTGAYVPAGDFARVRDAVAAGLISQGEVNAAAAAIRQAITDKKSAAEIVQIATSVIGGLVKVV